MALFITVVSGQRWRDYEFGGRLNVNSGGKPQRHRDQLYPRRPGISHDDGMAQDEEIIGGGAMNPGLVATGQKLVY